MQGRVRVIIGCALFGAWTAAQSAVGWAEVEAAANQGHLQDATELLQRMARERPQEALVEFRLAAVLLERRQPDAAASHLDRAEALKFPAGQIAWRRAQMKALQGRADDALALLDVALAQGLGPASQPDTDPLLAGVRSDPRFEGFLKRFREAVTPCRADPRYRELDYWVGTWDVRPRGAAPDSPASENLITLDHEQCIVQEHWRGRGGVTGQSFNLYDASRGAWFQTWVDSGGGMHEYKGRPDAQGNMVFIGETPGSPGQPARVPTRLTLYRLGPDEVRQFSESSVDGGASWTTNYDLVYTRRKP